MAVHCLEDLITWQLADELRREVTRLVQRSPEAGRDFKYRNQLLNAVSGVPASIAEGFARRSKRDFARFLDYAIGGLAEVESRLTDGVLRGYFSDRDAEPALRLKRRCNVASRRLRHTQTER